MKRVSRLLLAFDALIDSSVFDSGRGSRETYESFSAFMARFHVSGFFRVGVELACEMLTLGVGVGIVALALASSAFQMTSEKDWLKRVDLAVTFLDRHGATVGRRGIRRDDAVSLEQYPDDLLKAVLATEDRRFYEHFGIDLIGTARALTVNARSSNVVQGGSSITQQLAKNFFCPTSGPSREKINEGFLALWLEHRLTKREILQLYLDRVYMGGGTFGIQAAAEFYFGKSVKDVTLAEAAMLAGLFKAPMKYAPHVNFPAARARANDVFEQFGRRRLYDGRPNCSGAAQPGDASGEHAGTSPDWYLDHAYDEVQQLADAGKLGEDRVLTVRLALDSSIQNAPISVVEDNLRGEWSRLSRQTSRPRGDGARRRLTRDRGRARLRRQPIQSRDRGAAPAWILVQALRLSDSLDDRKIQTHHDRGRFSGLHRKLVPA